MASTICANNTPDWNFPRPFTNALLVHQDMHFQIRLKEPPIFLGEKGSDVLVWLRQVYDYLELTNQTKKHAIAYLTLLLIGNMHC